MKKTDQEKNKKTLYLFLSLFILVLSITGATYAYFALTASNNNTITGTVGGASLKLTVTKQIPSKNTNMIPQLESTLGEAISDKYSCVDDNENVVCQVYKATLTNTGSMTAELMGTISFQNISTLPNLKWALIQDEKTLGTYTSYPATTAEAIFETKQKFAPTDSKDYYFVIWIDEIEEEQPDYGTFRATINFTPANGDGSTGITSTIVPKKPKLSEVTPGSYVKYVGNNGCVGKACEGQNANYVDDSNMGYCYSASYKFKVNGWRVGYLKENSTYLISAGSPECMCTNSSGTSSSTSCSSYETATGGPQHVSNLNSAALKYCNSDYAYNGICNSNSVWNINDEDFQELTRNIGTSQTINSCAGVVGSDCGKNYDLIENGGHYWFGNGYTNSNSIYYRSNQSITGGWSDSPKGVRPVLRLNPNVVITSGTGTYEDPYEIAPN